MKAGVEPLEGNKVKLSVEVDEEEFEKAIDAAFRRIAREVRSPGSDPARRPAACSRPARHRRRPPGGAARGAARATTSRPSREHDVDAIAPPEIDITAGEDDGPSPSTPSSRSGPRSPSPATRACRSRSRVPRSPTTTSTPRSTACAASTASSTPSSAPPATATTSRSTSHGATRRRDRRRPARRRLPLRGRQRRRRARARRAARRRQGRRHRRLRRRPSRAGEDAGRLPRPGEGGQGEGAPRGRPTSGPARRRSSTPSTSCAPTSRNRHRHGQEGPGADGAARRRRSTRWSTWSTTSCPRRSSTPRSSAASQDLAHRLQHQGATSSSTSRPPARPAKQFIADACARRPSARSRPTSRCGPWPSRGHRGHRRGLDEEIATPGRAHRARRRTKVRKQLDAPTVPAVRSDIREAQGAGVARRTRRGRRRGRATDRPSPTLEPPRPTPRDHRSRTAREDE